MCVSKMAYTFNNLYMIYTSCPKQFYLNLKHYTYAINDLNLVLLN